MMDESQAGLLANMPPTSLHELSIAQLEALLLAKRQEGTHGLVRRIVAAQDSLDQEPKALPQKEGLPLRSPEGGGKAVYLRSGKLRPLTLAANIRARNVARRRDGILLFLKLALLLGFVVAIGLTFGRM